MWCEVAPACSLCRAAAAAGPIPGRRRVAARRLPLHSALRWPAGSGTGASAAMATPGTATRRPPGLPPEGPAAAIVDSTEHLGGGEAEGVLAEGSCLALSSEAAGSLKKKKAGRAQAGS